MYNPRKDKLAEFIQSAIPVQPNAEPEGVQRERERQEAMKERAAHIGTWKRYVAQERPAVPEHLVTGEALTQLRETCDLSVGDLAEVLSLSPNDVQSFERGQRTYADKSFHAFAAAARDAILENAERHNEGGE
jgi:ribosome-binding protein aMBF1 (putative translation factor)